VKSVSREGRVPGTTISISLRVFVSAVMTCALVLAAAVSAGASPSLDDKRRQAEAILAEVRVLDDEVGDAAERYNGASYELQQLVAELREAREDLVLARQLQGIARQRIAARLRELYIEGDNATSIEVIFGADSLDDVLNRIDLAERVASQDARIARDATTLRKRVTRREQQLDAAEARQAVVVEQRAAEVRVIEGRLAERQRLLASVQDEIARIEAEERRRQAELRRRAELELERQRLAVVAQRQALARAAEIEESSPETSEQALEGSDPLPGIALDVGYSPPPSDAGRGAQVVAVAMQYLGVRYKWGASSPSIGFDCSGLTTYVFAQIGVTLPHYAAAQYQLGTPVSKDELSPGDLVFFRGLGHMGMYIGGGNFIHAPRTGDVVKISSLSESYYVANWVGAKRVL
jgi:cell wall-associated NlpC family hydrolase